MPSTLARLPRTRRPSLRAIALGLLLPLLTFAPPGCGGSSQTARAAENVEKVCPQLESDTDPLTLPYSSNAQTDAALKTFVAAARGLVDVSHKMDSMVRDACLAMARDLNAPPVEHPEAAPIETACRPVAQEIERLRGAGLELSFQIDPPICSTDDAGRSGCLAVCTGHEATCAAACAARGDIYARCTLPSVEVSSNGQAEAALRLVSTLRANAPRLAYAELALGRRLLAHVQALVKSGAALSSAIRPSEPIGLACALGGAAAAIEAGARIEAVLESLSKLTQTPPAGKST